MDQWLITCLATHTNDFFMENTKTIKKAIDLLKQRNQMLETSKIKAIGDRKLTLVGNIQRMINKNASMILDFEFRLSKIEYK